MDQYQMETASPEDLQTVCLGLIAHNRRAVPFQRETDFLPVNRVIRDSDGEVCAGIGAEIYCWDCMSVDILWVRDDLRCRGLGSMLLQEAERIAKDHDCTLIHLDTFDFQARDFYERRGYQVFGILEDCPAGHCRYYMKKKL